MTKVHENNTTARAENLKTALQYLTHKYNLTPKDRRDLKNGQSIHRHTAHTEVTIRITKENSNAPIRTA